MRRFAVLLGATAPAVAAGLAAFFLGLGLGSVLFGRLAARFPRPIRVFAALEIGTGLSALAVDPLIGGLRPLYASMYDTSIDSAGLQLTLKIVVAALAVVVPAACIGGTLPILSQFVAARGRALGVRAGGLYAVNTLGAACGAIAVPAALLPALGATGSVRFVAGISIAIGFAAWFLLVEGPPNQLAARDTRRAAPPLPAVRLDARALALVSGILTLALEALAARAFSLVHENSIYSFATVVAVFLVGLGAGAALARALIGRGVAPRAVVAAGWAGAGVWIVWLPWLFVRVTGLEYLSGGRLMAHELHLAGLAAAVLLVPSLLLGLALPALMHEEGERSRAGGGAAVGSVMAANTVGSMAGPLLALFVLAPAWGLWTAVGSLGAAAVALAAYAALQSPVGLRRVTYAAAALGAAAFVVAPQWRLPRIALSASDRLLDEREGAFGSVAVVEHEGHRRIRLNNFYVLGGSGAEGDERLQGHIPLLLHPRPERVAYLGVGTGISLSAVRFHPARDVVALELVPEVAAAARAWFADANLGVLADPRVRIRAEDARSFAGATSRRFDVVIGDLVVPWRRGEAALFTRDSFAAVRRMLAPNGLYCQWIPLYQVSEAEFDSIAASFLDVFPNTTLWKGDFDAGQPALGLVGHTSPGGLDAAAADARVRALAESPDRSNPYLVHPAGLWLYFAGPLRADDPRFQSAPRNTDAHPWIELASSRLHMAREGSQPAGFTGRPLEARLDALRAEPVAGTAAASLTAQHLAWRDLGAAVWHASLLSFEGDGEAADRVGIAAVRRLPREIQTAVFGGAVK